MEGGEFFGEVVKILGGAGIGVGIMYLWIKSLLKEKESLQTQLKESQDARVEELKNVLPLLTSTSEGLQEVIADNQDRDTKLLQTITTHIDKTVSKINIKCKGGQ